MADLQKNSRRNVFESKKKSFSASIVAKGICNS